MEKRTPHYRLADVQAIVAKIGIQAFTATAAFNAAAMGLNESEAVAVILSLSRSMFYKSMPTTRFGKMFTTPQRPRAGRLTSN